MEREKGMESVVPGAITALLRELFRAPPDDGKALPALRCGQVVGRFELVRKLGQGGFGVVFEAFDRTLRRAVAFKVVRMGGDLELKEERILREAEAAAQLSHPNIVTLHDVGHCNQGPYLVMELLRGRTLGERLLEGPLPIAEALAVAIEVAKGVAHAHARGVVHRDVTPGNVFLCDGGAVKVLDFGMALAFGRGRVHGGTVAYMAPEQWKGEPEDERTDVFALGVVLHEMLSGTRPFADPSELMDGGGAPRLDVPGASALADLVGRMIAKDPALRPRDCGEVLAALVEEQRSPVSGNAVAARKRQRAWIAVATASAAAVVAALAFALPLPRAVTRAPARPAPAAPAVAVAPAPVVAVATALAERSVREQPPAALPARPPAATVPARADRGSPAPAPARRATRARTPAGSVRECRGNIDSVPIPAAASGEGVLTVVADPFGAVFVDGVRYGDTPGECRVAAGTYTVRVVHPKLGAREARVKVDAGGHARWAADFLAD